MWLLEDKAKTQSDFALLADIWVNWDPMIDRLNNYEFLNQAERALIFALSKEKSIGDENNLWNQDNKIK